MLYSRWSSRLGICSTLAAIDSVASLKKIGKFKIRFELKNIIHKLLVILEFHLNSLTFSLCYIKKGKEKNLKQLIIQWFSTKLFLCIYHFSSNQKNMTKHIRYIHLTMPNFRGKEEENRNIYTLNHSSHNETDQYILSCTTNLLCEKLRTMKEKKKKKEFIFASPKWVSLWNLLCES